MIEKGTLVIDVRLHGKKNKDNRQLVTATADVAPIVETVGEPIPDHFAVAYAAFGLALDSCSYLGAGDKAIIWETYSEDLAQLRKEGGAALLKAMKLEEHPEIYDIDDYIAFDTFQNGQYEDPVCNALDYVMNALARMNENSREEILDMFSDRWQALKDSIPPLDDLPAAGSVQDAGNGAKDLRR